MFIPTNFFGTTTRASASIEYLLVGGGGSGALTLSGGGGGGGFISGSLTLTQYVDYPIIIGSGGISLNYPSESILMHGQPTYALGFVAYGGGSGESSSPGFDSSSMFNGASGGGGGDGVQGVGLAIHNNVYMTQGNDGGTAYFGEPAPPDGQTAGSYGSGGGGGGASITGSATLFLLKQTSPVLRYVYRGGNGGNGKQWLDGNTYGGGGGGFSRSQVSGYDPGFSTGGTGGGGRGGLKIFLDTPIAAIDGTPNTGGGGGGYLWLGDNPGLNANAAGGSGIVKIRYVSGSVNATGGTITNTGGYTYHTFLSSSVFTLLE